MQRICWILGLTLLTGIPGALATEGVSEFTPPDLTPYVFQDCPDCPAVAVVPAQEHQVGSDTGRPEEAPARRHQILQPFAMATTEVTFDQWQACVVAQRCPAVENDNGWGRATRPVMRVSLEEAEGYAQWLSDMTGNGYAIPTEAEWEAAARAGTVTRYWWGPQMQPGQAHCRHCDKTDLTTLTDKGLHQTLPVASFAPNPYGLYDMVGNVWEWTTTCWEEAADTTCERRATKGGSWYFFGVVGGSPARAAMRQDQKSYDVGFRVKRLLTPDEVQELPRSFWQFPEN